MKLLGFADLKTLNKKGRRKRLKNATTKNEDRE
jgi:hypothetical protein